MTIALITLFVLFIAIKTFEKLTDNMVNVHMANREMELEERINRARMTANQ